MDLNSWINHQQFMMWASARHYPSLCLSFPFYLHSHLGTFLLGVYTVLRTTRLWCSPTTNDSFSQPSSLRPAAEQQPRIYQQWDPVQDSSFQSMRLLSCIKVDTEVFIGILSSIYKFSVVSNVTFIFFASIHYLLFSTLATSTELFCHFSAITYSHLTYWGL